uniref:EamA domain-containing protein n=1 Tax=Chlamydomonas leiostraca TaxID=1034604 RepID=A0A7S0WT80_9CHLO
MQTTTTKQLLWAVALAQGLSFLLCLMGITSQVLANNGINAPTTQSLCNYALLACTCWIVHLWLHKWRLPAAKNKWYVYALLAFLDVEANFLVTKAYQFTSITSVTLLDCFTIPAVMALSWVVFRARYRAVHLVGAALCVAGLVVLVLTDGSSTTGGSNPVLGDVLVICGACVYAVCNVAQERLLVDTSRWELLAYVGSFGAGIAGVQALVLELGAWQSAQWGPATWGALAGFALSLYTFSLLLPSVLMWGGSTVLNLSLLTSDLWAAGARAAFFGGFGGTAGFFVLAMVCEGIGITAYTFAGNTHQYQAVDTKDGNTGTPGISTGFDFWPAAAGAGNDACHQQRASSEYSDLHLEHQPLRSGVSSSTGGPTDGLSSRPSYAAPSPAGGPHSTSRLDRVSGGYVGSSSGIAPPAPGSSSPAGAHYGGGVHHGAGGAAGLLSGHFQARPQSHSSGGGMCSSFSPSPPQAEASLRAAGMELRELHQSQQHHPGLLARPAAPAALPSASRTLQPALDVLAHPPLPHAPAPIQQQGMLGLCQAAGAAAAHGAGEDDAVHVIDLGAHDVGGDGQGHSGHDELEPMLGGHTQ